MPKVTKVGVERTSEHGNYCLAWQTPEGQFHLWMIPNEFHTKTHGFEILRATGSKGRQIYKRPHEGAGVTYLHLDIAKNRAMFDDAMAQAVAGHLFEKCDQKIAQAEKERLAKAAAEYKVKLAQEAAPEMLKVLRAIAEFWSGEQKDFPLSPGALIIPAGHFFSSADGGEKILAKTSGILNPDDYQTIADAVRRVVFFAETGGAVELPQTEVE